MAWVFLGESSEADLTPNNWKEFTVSHEIMIYTITITITKAIHIYIYIYIYISHISTDTYLGLMIMSAYLIQFHFLSYLQKLTAIITAIGFLSAAIFQIGTPESRKKTSRVCFKCRLFFQLSLFNALLSLNIV